MSAVILKHLDALAASMQLALAQIDAARHALDAPAPSTPKVRVDLPLRCAGVDPKECALRDGEWDESRASFADPGRQQCPGCAFERSGGA